MAYFRADLDEVVLRIVYAGAGGTGKTTSVRALAKELRQSVATPAEDDGRTLYFDWTEYLGGSFEGRKIRCQIVSVPGQPELADRRRSLLREADAVVLVANTTEPGIAEAMEHLEELEKSFAERPGPPVGIVVQANKRDLPESVSRTRLLSLFDDAAQTLPVETVATRGKGVRLAFVLAVRLAVDRLQSLRREGKLPQARTEIDTAEELLDRLVAAETAAAGDPTRCDLAPQPRPTPSEARRAPAPPEPDVTSGRIWPPVEGRIVLRKAQLRGIFPQRLEDGAWLAEVDSRWRVHSAADACYQSLEEGRKQLVRWARNHSACRSLLSPGRCIVLSETGDGAWRLWQVVRVERSLRHRLHDALVEGPATAARELSVAARALTDAANRFASAVEVLPVDLDSLALLDGLPVFIGLFRSPGDRDEGNWAPVENGPTLLNKRLGSVLREHYEDHPEDVPLLAEHLWTLAEGSPTHSSVPAILLQIVASVMSGTVDHR